MDARKTSSFFSSEELRERETRRAFLVKVTCTQAEISTTLAEKELQQWHRTRSGSQSSTATMVRKGHGYSESATFKLQESALSTASSPRMLDTRLMPVSFTPRTDSFRSTFQYIPKSDHEKALREKTHEVIIQLDQQRKELTESFARKLKENEETLRKFYGGKIEELEERLRNSGETTLRELKVKLANAVGSGENRVARLEEQLRLEKNRAREREEDARHLLADKSAEISNLRQEVSRLLSKIEEDEIQIRKLSDLLASQNEEIASLTSKSQACESDYTALAQELNEVKLQSRREVEGTLKTRVRELEQESELLKRDYEALMNLHKRTLQEKEEKSLFAFIQKGYEKEEVDDEFEDESMRELYSRKCLQLTEEAIQWKEKTLMLATKHHLELQTLRSEKKLLKEEIDTLREETSRQMADLLDRLPLPKRAPSPHNQSTSSQPLSHNSR